MLTKDTIVKLQEMGLKTMAAGFSGQLADPSFNQIGFEDRFSMLVDAEWSSRQSNKLRRLIQKAGYADTTACIENLAYRPERQLDRAQVLRLASGAYIEKAHNLIILGATGTGKTYLACALGLAANRMYYGVKYIRMPDLLVEIAIARGNGTFRDLMNKYKKIKLLILDEWLLYPLKETETRDLLELVKARNQTASTIFCSQYEPGGWHEMFFDPIIADSICDRVVHTAYTITIHGESMRKINALSND